MFFGDIVAGSGSTAKCYEMSHLNKDGCFVNGKSYSLEGKNVRKQTSPCRMCKEEKFLIVDPTSERIFSTVGSEISAIKLAWTLAMWTIHCLFKLKWSNGVIKFLFILFNKNEDKLLYSVEPHWQTKSKR